MKLLFEALCAYFETFLLLVIFLLWLWNFLRGEGKSKHNLLAIIVKF